MLPGVALDLLLSGESVKAEKNRCVHMRFSGTGCCRCVDVCPHQAIVLEPGPIIDPAKCSGCLLCESVCPTGAFADGDRLARTLASLADIASPVLGCNRRDGVAGHARIGCFGLLASPEILLALCIYLPQGLTLNLTCCGECPNGSIFARLKAALEDLLELPEVQAHQAIRLVDNEKALHFQEKSLSRRELFTFFRTRSTEVAANSLDRLQKADQQASYRAKRLPQRRSLLLGALSGMTKPLRQAVEKRFFPVAEFHDSCRACSGCVGICPTGALAPSLEHAGTPLFKPAQCTDCGLCETFCQRGGITLTLKRP